MGRKPTNGFKPGNVANPKGRAKEHHPLLNAILHHTREDLILIYQRCTNLTLDQCHNRLMDPEITMLERSFITAILADLELGQVNTLLSIIERIHGKTIQPITAQIGVVTLEQLIVSSEKLEKKEPVTYEIVKEIGTEEIRIKARGETKGETQSEERLLGLE